MTAIGVSFEVIPSQVAEEIINGESPEAHVSRLARAKALEVAGRIPGRWVLGADTIVVIDEKILGKPENRDHAVSMLKTLASRTHEVYTGYALVNASRPEHELVRCVCTEVFVRSLTDDEIQAYVDTGEPMDKAGAYAIQGIGCGIVESISGSYTNVVGLPICEVAQDLKKLGILHFLEKGKRLQPEELTNHQDTTAPREPIPDAVDYVASRIVDAAFRVHSNLGPGLLESIYEICLTHELKKQELRVARQLSVPIDYDGMSLEAGLRLDLLVEDCVIVEVKTVQNLLPVHHAQMLTYLKLTGRRLGLLINFNVPLIKKGIKRIVL